MTPVLELMEAPAGRPVALHVMAPLAQDVMVAFGVTVSVAVSATVLSLIGSTVTGALSMVPAAGPPIVLGSVALLQSRSVSSSIVTENAPEPF